MPIFLPDRHLLPAFLFHGPANVAVNAFHPHPSNWSELVPAWDEYISPHISTVPFSEVSQDLFARLFWVQITEFLLWPAVQHFSSLFDLVLQLQSARGLASHQHGSFESIKRQMRMHSTKELNEKIIYWRGALGSLLCK